MRVLHVIAGMGSGGAESFIMNMYRRVDRSKVQFDFLLRSHENMYADEIADMGGRVFYTSRFPRHFIRNWYEVKRILRQHPEVEVIHVHANALLYLSVLVLAKRYGIRRRIMHSHNTKPGRPSYRLIHKLNRRLIQTLATDHLACSEDAGRWMFRGRFRVVKNAVDTQKFTYSPAVRAEVRAELDLADRFVVGHVGRFLRSKNHMFLLGVFAEVLKREPKAILVLVGSGPLEGEVRQRADDLGIRDSVRFLGVRSDVERLMQAMDVFVLPSHFEGLPVVLIEAQAAGLISFASSVVPPLAQASSLLEFINLNEGASGWAERILRGVPGWGTRRDTGRELAAAGFDVGTEAKLLEEFYLTEPERTRV